MKTIFKVKESEKDRIRKLHEAHKSFHGTSLINEQITSSSSGVDEDGNVTKIEKTTVQFPPEIIDEGDDTKKYWYCMQDRDNRGWNMSEDTYNRFYLLHSAIEGHLSSAGTDEDLVWMALSGSMDPKYKGNKTIPKGRIGENQLQQMMPILSCMKSDKPWEQDYMKENDLGLKGTWGWIMDDFSGIEACYLHAFLKKKGRGDCDQKHGYFWWNKASNWIKGLF